MIDGYIFIAVWSVILIMLIVELGKVQSRLAEDRINKMFEYLKKRKRERLAMPRYIDAKQKITVTYYDEEHEEWSKKSKTIDDFLYENADEEIPIADVRENVHAKWVKVGQSFLNPNRFRCYACSKCGFSIDYIQFRFCPNCGAEMDEGR